MSAYVIPSIILILLLIAVIKKVNVYDSFIDGAKQSLTLVYSIFPFICAVYIAVNLFQTSGFNMILQKLLTPVFSLLKIPVELTELIIIRPLSGNGAIAILQNIYNSYGADSYISRTASVIMGSSETIFYISAVYFSTIKNKKIGKGIIISLIASVFGIIASCLLTRCI